MIGRRVLVYSLRREYRFSGEANTLRSLEVIFSQNDDVLLGANLEKKELNSCLGSIFPFYRDIRELRHLIHEYAPDLVIMKVPTAAQLLFVRLITSQLSGISVIPWVEGLLWRPLPWRMFLILLRKEPALLISRMLLNNRFWLFLANVNKKQIVVSSNAQSKEVAVTGCITSIIPNGSCEEGFGLLDVFDKKRIIPNGSFTFGYIGHAYFTKGVFELLAALVDLKKTGVQFKAKFALSDLGSRELIRGIREAGFDVYGKVDKAVFYASIDCLVLPYWSGWGTNVYPSVILESLKYGVPVVTSDLPVTVEALGGCGTYIRVGDYPALVEVLTKIVGGGVCLPDSSMLEARYVERFSLPVLSALWDGFLGEILSDSGVERVLEENYYE